MAEEQQLKSRLLHRKVNSGPHWSPWNNSLAFALEGLHSFPCQKQIYSAMAAEGST